MINVMKGARRSLQPLSKPVGRGSLGEDLSGSSRKTQIIESMLTSWKDEKEQSGGASVNVGGEELIVATLARATFSSK